MSPNPSDCCGCSYCCSAEFSQDHATLTAIVECTGDTITLTRTGAPPGTVWIGGGTSTICGKVYSIIFRCLLNQPAPMGLEFFSDECTRAVAAPHCEAISCDPLHVEFEFDFLEDCCQDSCRVVITD